MIKYTQKRSHAWEPKPSYICTFCGAKGEHYSSACFKRPKHPIRKESDKAKAKGLSVKQEWLGLNQPNENGEWTCYLQISPECPKQVNKVTINLEHVIARTRNPGLKYSLDNIRPSCQACNKLKGAWSLEQLAETYPQIRELLEREKNG